MGLDNVSSSFQISVGRTRSGDLSYTVINSAQCGLVYGGASDIEMARNMLTCVKSAFAAGVQGTENGGFSVKTIKALDGHKTLSIVGNTTGKPYGGLRKSFFSFAQRPQVTALQQTIQYAYAMGAASRQQKPTVASA